MENKKVLVIEVDKDIRISENFVSLYCRKLPFSKFETSQILLSVSEIVTNVIKHAGKGVLNVDLLQNGKGLVVVIKDFGPGIPDIAKAMEGGHSTVRGSLGLGLAAAKRAMDEFTISSTVNQGTTVTMVKYLPISFEEIEYGIASTPKTGEIVNGDTYVIKEYNGDTTLLAIIDGEGHGSLAHEASLIVKDIIEQNYKLPLDQIILSCDKAILGDELRGCVLGLCRINPTTIEYLGLGDTEIMVITDAKIDLYSQPGELGKKSIGLPTLRVQTFNCPRVVTVIMNSDGIINHFLARDIPHEYSSQQIADFILKDYNRGSDDATVLTAKRKK